MLVAPDAMRAPAAAEDGQQLSESRSAGGTSEKNVSPKDASYRGGHVLGASDAPIAIVEYASLTCPHCARFHTETLPKLKEEWIETGKAKLVYRHYPLDRLALAAALMANCFEGERFFAVIDMLFRRQQEWTRAEKPGEALARIAGLAGMDREGFEACVTDQAEARQILDKQERARQQTEIEATPTFLIDGRKIEGAQPYEKFDEVLREVQDSG